MAKTILAVFPGVFFINTKDITRAAINPKNWLKNFEKKQSKVGVK